MIPIKPNYGDILGVLPMDLYVGRNVVTEHVNLVFNIMYNRNGLRFFDLDLVLGKAKEDITL